MRKENPSSPPAGRAKPAFVAAILAITLVAGACGGTTTPAPGGASVPPTTSAQDTAGTGSTTEPGPTTTTGTSGSVVLPVSDNPIQNRSTAQTLKIDSVLVENNVDSAGKTTSDHLEIALSNIGTSELSGFEVFYTLNDPTASLSESYYAKLPDSFTIPAGGTRKVHFDNTGAADHFAVNEFSLYYTSTNALDVTVTVSATGAAVQTAAVHKDAGGAETAD